MAGAGEDLSDQSDDPFAYDDIEARRKGWDETTTGVSKPTKKSKHFIGGEDVRQPGDIITPKEKGKSLFVYWSAGQCHLFHTSNSRQEDECHQGAQ